MDEIYAANSIAFDPAGDRPNPNPNPNPNPDPNPNTDPNPNPNPNLYNRLYGGYKEEIRMFDLARPGRETCKVSTGSRKMGGQRNLISCMAISPDMSGLLAPCCAGKTVSTFGLASCVA